MSDSGQFITVERMLGKTKVLLERVPHKALGLVIDFLERISGDNGEAWADVLKKLFRKEEPAFVRTKIGGLGFDSPATTDQLFERIAKLGRPCNQKLAFLAMSTIIGPQDKDGVIYIPICREGRDSFYQVRVLSNLLNVSGPYAFSDAKFELHEEVIYCH